MKRRDFIRHLSNEGCGIYREGTRHSVFFNPENGRLASVPRYREIEINLAKKICRQLDISLPKAGA
jgi:mRNA interferase HicA